MIGPNSSSPIQDVESAANIHNAASKAPGNSVEMQPADKSVQLPLTSESEGNNQRPRTAAQKVATSIMDYCINNPTVVAGAGALGYVLVGGKLGLPTPPTFIDNLSANGLSPSPAQGTLEIAGAAYLLLGPKVGLPTPAQLSPGMAKKLGMAAMVAGVINLGPWAANQAVSLCTGHGGAPVSMAADRV